MNKKTVKDIDLKGKRVLMRVDFNVPMADGKVTDDKRIKASLPTIQYVLDQGASVILMSHLGRPKGGPDPEFSLKAAAEVLSGHLKRPVQMATDCVGPEVDKLAKALKPGDVLMLENTRFHAGEEKNDLDLSSMLHLGHGHFRFESSPNDARSLGAQSHQFFDRFGGASFCARFQKFSKFDERDDDRGRLVVDVSHQQAKGDRERVEERGGGTHHDQHVHVGGFVAQGFERADVILPAHVELNGERKHEHQPTEPGLRLTHAFHCSSCVKERGKQTQIFSHRE